MKLLILQRLATSWILQSSIIQVECTLRLGFAIAVNINPEILLIDEVLSVGDLAFQNKSMAKLAETRKKFKGGNLRKSQVGCRSKFV